MRTCTLREDCCAMQGSKDELSPIALPAHASMWHANLPDISQGSVNAAAKAAALASVGDKLVDSLQAQSLDLPPQAAKVLCSECITGISMPWHANSLHMQCLLLSSSFLIL